MTRNAANLFATFSKLRTVWGENQNDADAYHAMRSAYHAWQRAEQAEPLAWDDHEKLNARRLGI